MRKRIIHLIDLENYVTEICIACITEFKDHIDSCGSTTDHGKIADKRTLMSVSRCL